MSVEEKRRTRMIMLTILDAIEQYIERVEDDDGICVVEYTKDAASTGKTSFFEIATDKEKYLVTVEKIPDA